MDSRPALPPDSEIGRSIQERSRSEKDRIPGRKQEDSRRQNRGSGEVAPEGCSFCAKGGDQGETSEEKNFRQDASPQNRAGTDAGQQEIDGTETSQEGSGRIQSEPAAGHLARVFYAPAQGGREGRKERAQGGSRGQHQKSGHDGLQEKRSIERGADTRLGQHHEHGKLPPQGQRDERGDGPSGAQLGRQTRRSGAAL